MTKIVTFPTPKIFPPSKEEMEKRVRDLMADKSRKRVMWDEQRFPLQMRKRQLDMIQIIDVLNEGEITDDPKLDEYGDWTMKLEKKWPSGRKIQLVTALTETHLDLVAVI